MRCFTLLACVLAVNVVSAQELGKISNFIVSGNGPESVELSWDYEEGDAAYVLHKYVLVTDNDFSNDVRCNYASCSYTVDFLTPCVEHTFELTPYFTDPSGGADLQGAMTSTTGYTQDLLVGSPSNVALVGDNAEEGTTVQWEAPTQNPQCAHHYQVCFRLDGEIDSQCAETPDTSITYEGLQACGTYHVTVTPVTPSGNQAESDSELIQTRTDVPGPPKDVVVGLTTPDTIQLLWNDPEQNPMCVDKYVITYGETHAFYLVGAGVGRKAAEEYDHQSTISPLLPCTNYTIDICSQNSDEMTSDAVINYASTAETDPLPPPSVVVTPTGTDTIEVVWGSNEDDRCAASFEICWTDGIHPYEQCESVPGGGGGGGSGSGDNNHFIATDLLPCTNYDFSVSVVSPGGNNSDPVSNSSATADVRPGHVENLMITAISSTTMDISYDPPSMQQQCVKEYDTHHIDEDEETLVRVSRRQAVTPYLGEIGESMTGLKACTNYLIRVRAVSPAGLNSPFEDVRNKTLAEVPSEPQMLAAGSVDATSIVLEWFSPADHPRCVTSYRLEWTSDGGSSLSTTISDTSSFKTTHLVNGLTSCTDYIFTVHATSDVGDGPSTSATIPTSGC